MSLKAALQLHLVANEQQYDILTSIILILNCLRHSFLPRQPLGDQSCRPVLGADERHFTPLHCESRRPTYVRGSRIGMLSMGWRQFLFWCYVIITLLQDNENFYFVTNCIEVLFQSFSIFAFCFFINNKLRLLICSENLLCNYKN